MAEDGEAGSLGEGQVVRRVGSHEGPRGEKQERLWAPLWREQAEQVGDRLCPGCWHHCGTVGPFTVQSKHKKNI